MKKFIILISIVGISVHLQAQSKDSQDISLSEIYTNKTGVVIEKQYVEAGNIDVIDIRILKSKDLTNNTVNNALRFEYQFNNEVQSQTKVAILDGDEIDPLLNALKIYQDNILKSKRQYNTEVTFTSRSGIVVGCFYKLEKNKWITYIQLNNNDPKSTVFVESDEFTHFIELLESAKTKLQTL